MKKPEISGMALIAVILALLLSFPLVGCKKDGSSGDATVQIEDEDSEIDPDAPPVGAMAPPGMPFGGPPGAGAPGAVPAEGAAATGTIPPKPEVAFGSVGISSGITRVNVTKDGIPMQFLRFKYTDWSGVTQSCELPAAESKANRTADAWIATFDTYKLPPTPSKAAAAKKKRAQTAYLSDFPFVSPPPAPVIQQPSGMGGGFMGYPGGPGLPGLPGTGPPGSSAPPSSGASDGGGAPVEMK